MLPPLSQRQRPRPTPTRRAFTRGALGALALAPAGVLAACGGGGEGGGGELPRAGTRDVALRFVMHQDNSEIPTFTGIAEAFTQRLLKVKVDVEPIPWDDYPSKITAMIAGGTPPDCCYQASRRVIGFAANGQTVDLNGLVKRDREAKGAVRRRPDLPPQGGPRLQPAALDGGPAGPHSGPPQLRA
ncbi:MAG TPA: extracellular solute-binding protein, partial [Chloroflexota bacterium]|nr:extracellular solute-binding protein [Chloroflexota bacterium]